MLLRFSYPAFIFIACLGFTHSPILAKTSLSGGVWANYKYVHDDPAVENSWGQIGDEALIIYLDGAADAPEERWFYSAEVRAGPGSFTDPDNNSTGDQWTLHKAWVGWKLNQDHQVLVGKSQVPFGWKTINFWPGDILLAGFGDQMDVGVKLQGGRGAWHYDSAFYLADDWGSTSTDTVDDNRHWGSQTTYRKVQTFVVNGRYRFTPQQTLGISLQKGRLQNLQDPEHPVDGDHWAAVVYYEAEFEQWFTKASIITMQRELPARYAMAQSLPDQIENERLALEVGYGVGAWLFYVDASWAEPNTEGNTADSSYALAPGFSYDYGPGWVYVELLTQDGFVDRDGMVNSGDFDALYVSLDFYF